MGIWEINYFQKLKIRPLNATTDSSWPLVTFGWPGENFEVRIENFFFWRFCSYLRRFVYFLRFQGSLLPFPKVTLWNWPYRGHSRSPRGNSKIIKTYKTVKHFVLWIYWTVKEFLEILYWRFIRQYVSWAVWSVQVRVQNKRLNGPNEFLMW